MTARICPHCNGTGRIEAPRTIGAKARKRREKANLSLRSVADAMGISAPHLSDMELGKRRFTTEQLAKFNKAIQ